MSHDLIFPSQTPTQLPFFSLIWKEIFVAITMSNIHQPHWQRKPHLTIHDVEKPCG
jgi:hypothetical protein